MIHDIDIDPALERRLKASLDEVIPKLADAPRPARPKTVRRPRQTTRIMVVAAIIFVLCGLAFIAAERTKSDASRATVAPSTAAPSMPPPSSTSPTSGPSASFGLPTTALSADARLLAESQLPIGRVRIVRTGLGTTCLVIDTAVPVYTAVVDGHEVPGNVGSFCTDDDHATAGQLAAPITAPGLTATLVGYIPPNSGLNIAIDGHAVDLAANGIWTTDLGGIASFSITNPRTGTQSFPVDNPTVNSTIVVTMPRDAQTPVDEP